MDRDLANYVFRYFGRLMTAEERLANLHLIATMKGLGSFRSDKHAQEEAKKNKLSAAWLTDDSNVLRMAEGGYDEFVARTAKRILTEHADQVFLNRCPRCGALARTPKSRQCRFCGLDWHEQRPANQDTSL